MLSDGISSAVFSGINSPLAKTQSCAVIDGSQPTWLGWHKLRGGLCSGSLYSNRVAAANPGRSCRLVDAGRPKWSDRYGSLAMLTTRTRDPNSRRTLGLAGTYRSEVAGWADIRRDSKRNDDARRRHSGYCRGSFVERHDVSTDCRGCGTVSSDDASKI